MLHVSGHCYTSQVFRPYLVLFQFLAVYFMFFASILFLHFYAS